MSLTAEATSTLSTRCIDDGTRLTELAIVQYIADKAPGSNLAPANGTLPRYQLQEWLNFITAELHKAILAAVRLEYARGVEGYSAISWRNEWIAATGDKDYLMGSSFTVADAYLFTVTNWARSTGIDMSRWPTLQSYMKRVAAPHVQVALKAEGLLK